MSSVAIVGYGRFGAALASLLEEAGHAITAWDPAPAPDGRPLAETLEEAAHGADFVVLSVPIERVGPVARRLAAGLTPAQVVVDVCSVKVFPSQALGAALTTPWVATHPLFGPASIARGERPLRVVVCPSAAFGEAEAAVRALFAGLGCQVLTMDAHDHDRRMAESHALGFFLARGLLDAGAGFDSPVTPPSSLGIARTIASVRSDAGHLLGALHGENPYAAEMRGKVIEALTALDGALSAETEQRRSGADVDLTEVSLRIPDLGSRSPALREVRELIDELDGELLGLLARRAVLSRRARAAKADLGAGVRDPRREAQLRRDRRDRADEHGLDADAVDDVFAAILRLSVALQEREGM